jgi:hypothetical protein
MGNYLNRLELIKSLAPTSGAEVGVMGGEFSQQLLSIPTLKRLYLIDQWKHVVGTPYEFDGSNVDEGGHETRYQCILGMYEKDYRVVILRADSALAAKQVQQVDFAFIDAAHHFDAVWRDLDAWSRATNHLICHDYFSAPPVFDVPRAIEAFLNSIAGTNWRIAGVTQEPEYQSAHLVYDP